MSCKSNTCGPVKWAARQVGIKSDCEVAAAPSGQKYFFDADTVLRGVQSVGYDTNFDQTPIFQLSQGEIYEIVEGIPVVDISINKALDGYCPVYLAATKDADNPTLFGRGAQFANVAISIFPCTLDSAKDEAKATVVFPDVQVGSVGYTFGVDGAFTEDVTLRGNNVIWYNPAGNPGHAAPCPSGGCSPSAQFLADVATIQFDGFNIDNDQRPLPKVQRREDLVFKYDSAAPLDENCMVADPDATILPPEVYGISPSGTNDDEICIQSISISVDLGREDINCLGKRGPQNRSITTPVQVTTTIEVISECGDNVSATEYGVCNNALYGVGSPCANVGTNAPNRTIRVATCDGLRVYTGLRNKVSGVSTQGGNTDGGNMTVTYTFTTFNTLVVMHENDIAPSGTVWWNNRDLYLCNPN